MIACQNQIVEWVGGGVGDAAPRVRNGRGWWEGTSFSMLVLEGGCTIQYVDFHNPFVIPKVHDSLPETYCRIYW